jgi:hypothetical protein
MPTLLHTPEAPIGEDWKWQTDVILKDDGTEQSIELSDLPQRLFRTSFVYDDVDELRRDMALTLAFGQPFDAPLWQYQTKLKAPAAMAETVLSILASRTDLRVGDDLYIFDKDGGEVRTIDALASNSVTLTAGLSRAYGTRAAVCPVRTLYSAGNAALDRLNPDRAARASWTLREVYFNDPFVHEFNEATLTMLGTLPVLEFRPIGTEFNEGVDTGAEVMDFGGALDIRDRWTSPKQNFARRFKSDRVFDPDDWDKWRVFADYAKGSCNPFYLPTYREDFGLVTPPALGGTTLVFEGALYRTDYFPHEAFKGVAIYTSAGVHYATVTNAINSGGNTQITFNPALPGSAGWNVGTTASLLLKCRIADDRISCNHFPLHTDIELNLRTVND